MIGKRFSSSIAEALLEKAIRKKIEMFRHEMSVRKPFFIKATCSSNKKEFLHILLSLKISKNVQKKTTKTFRKIINRSCFDEYFYRYILKVDKSSLQISFKAICSEQMYNVEHFGRYFSFCPRLT